MRWPREDWLEAFYKTTAPRPPERAVVLAYWGLAGDAARATGRGVKQVSVETKTLASLCGLSRAAAHDAVRYLIATGWLTPVGVQRSGRTVPHELTIGRDADARREGHQRTRSTPREVVLHDLSTLREVVQDDLSTPREVVQDDAEVVQDDLSARRPISPTETPPPQTREAAVDALWLVLVGNLPPALGLAVTRSSRIVDALGRHYDEGWTAATMAAAVAAKDWTNARGGLVDTWLTNLPKPTAWSAKLPGSGWPTKCNDCNDKRQIETDRGMARCPTCHPLARRTRLAS